VDKVIEAYLLHLRLTKSLTL